MEKWVIAYVIGFVLRQLDKFQHEIDWSKVKADVDVRIRALVPGKMFGEEAVKLVNTILDETAFLMSEGPQLKAILDLLAAEKWSEAGQALLAMLMDAVKDAATKASLVDFQKANLI